MHPITKPTMAGVTVEARDQVLIGVLSPDFRRETFSMSLGSVNGPFFKLRDILFGEFLAAAALE